MGSILGRTMGRSHVGFGISTLVGRVCLICCIGTASGGCNTWARHFSGRNLDFGHPYIATGSSGGHGGRPVPGDTWGTLQGAEFCTMEVGGWMAEDGFVCHPNRDNLSCNYSSCRICLWGRSHLRRWFNRSCGRDLVYHSSQCNRTAPDMFRVCSMDRGDFF